MDRVTIGVSLVSISQLENVYKTFGVDYPICGDSLAIEKEARGTYLEPKITIKPLTESEKRLISVMNRQVSNLETIWKEEQK